MQRNGYELVACDSRAVNAFWVDRSKSGLFTSRPGARHQYVPGMPGSGHRRHLDPTVDSPVDLDHITLGRYSVRSLRGCSKELHTFKVDNRSGATVNSFGTHPIRVGGVDSAGTEPVRLFIDESIRPGESGTARVVLPRGARFSSAAVVQEGVGWGPFVKPGR